MPGDRPVKPKEVGQNSCSTGHSETETFTGKVEFTSRVSGLTL